MSRYSRTQVSDSILLHQFAARLARGHADTADLLADIAEIDARKLYLPAGYPSMYLFCVDEFHLSEDAAFRRIRAARAAREFPVIFDFVADGRLSLTAVITLAPHLTAATVDELLAAATHKTKAAITLLLAQRFPQPDVATRVEAIGVSSAPSSASDLLSPGSLALARVDFAGPPAQVTPLAPERYKIQFTMDQEAWDLLCEAKELLGHQLPSGDEADVIKAALRVYVRELKKRKFAATDKPRATRRHSSAPRHIPAHVKRAVWERDGGQCSFVGESGNRCPSRTLLEFDHIDEVALGGRATVAGMRLLCRAHNQYAAECTFGAEFMKHKRDEAQRVAIAARVQAREAAAARTPELATASHTQAQAAANAAEEAQRAQDQDVVPWLRRLGFRADETRRAAAFCANIADASLEERVRAALRFLAPRVPSRRYKQPWAAT